MTKNTRFWLSSSSCLSLILTASVSAQAAEEKKPVQLPTVQVEANRDSEENTYYITEPSLSKLTAPLLDTPQTINTVPRELLDDQRATTLREALRNVPGISLAAGEGGNQGDNLTVRGFSARSDIFRDGMRDFGSYYRDPFNLESVEVLKGPASLLFGRGSTGGVINQVSKTAKLGNSNNSIVTLGTNSTLREETDINQQIDSTTAFRLNIMGNYNQTAERDAGESKRYGIAPSLAFGLGTDTRINLDYFHETEDNIPDYGIPYLESRPAPVDRGNFYGFEDHDYFHTSADIGTLKLEHDLTNDVTVSNKTRYGFYARDVQITEARYSPVPALGTPPSAITVQRGQIAAKSQETFLTNQTDVNAEFRTFGLKNKAAAGLELTRESSAPKRYGFTGVPTANLADPHPSDDYAGVKSITSNTKAKAHTVAAYAVDTLSLNDQWDITAGLRYDWVRSDYDQTVGAESHFNRIDRMPSYRAGIVYKPAKNGSIYFSHGTSFNPSIEQLALSAATATVDPEESEVYELGTKWDLLDKKLGVSAAVFHDVKTNARTPDPIDPLSTVLQGEQVVDGLELSATGNLTDKWQVYSGYALLMSDVSESNTANEEGHQLANVPKHTFNLFTTYDVTNKWQVGAGTNMVSERKARATPDANTGVVAEVPGYTTYDAMTKYNITDSVSIQLNVYNITNKEYFDQLHPGHLIPGGGRTALLSTSFSL